MECCFQVMYLYVEIECRNCNSLYYFNFFSVLNCRVLCSERVLSCCLLCFQYELSFCSASRMWNVV